MPGTSNEDTKEEASLSEELKDIAHRELGETPEVRREAIEQLRKLLADDPSLHSPTDDAFLTKFLRARKYNVDKAFKNIKKYFEARKNQRDMFEDSNPATIAFDIACRKHHLVTLSNGRDPNGIPVIMVKSGTWTTEICSLTNFMRVCVLHMEYLLLDEEVQTKGLVIVFDVKGLGIYHLTQYTPFFIRRVLSLLQNCFPLRIKAVYVSNNPVLFDIFLNIAKPFMKSKLLRRVRLLGYDGEKLRDLLPDDLIPQVNGGTLESHDYDVTARKLQSRGDFFREISEYGYRDEMKRPS
ncbi:alpha-tocopherol transfer protein-like isoform X1 [Haemaphysalis longicornis]